MTQETPNTEQPPKQTETEQKQAEQQNIIEYTTRSFQNSYQTWISQRSLPPQIRQQYKLQEQQLYLQLMHDAGILADLLNTCTDDPKKQQQINNAVKTLRQTNTTPMPSNTRTTTVTEAYETILSELTRKGLFGLKNKTTFKKTIEAYKENLESLKKNKEPEENNTIEGEQPIEVLSLTKHPKYTDKYQQRLGDVITLMQSDEARKKCGTYINLLITVDTSLIFYVSDSKVTARVRLCDRVLEKMRADYSVDVESVFYVNLLFLVMESFNMFNSGSVGRIWYL